MLVSGDDNGEQSNNFVERAQQNNGSLVYQWCCDRAGARRSAPLRTRTGMTLAADASRWALSPDGSTVAVVVPGRSTIDLVRVADGSHRRLWKGDTDDEVVEFVGWESDGTHLRAAVLGGTTQFRWIRIDAQTGRVATVPASYVPNGYAIPVNGRAALLPNGRLLQLLPRDDANVSVAEVDVTTGAAIVLVSLNRTDTQSETYSVAIDHDGTHALVSSHRGIFEIDLATRRARLISHTPLTGASFVDG